MNPNYSVKKPKLLYIDRNGFVYPDCKTYKTPYIGRIDDPGIVDAIQIKVFGGNMGVFNMITVEVSSACNANCLYCFQNDGRRGEKYNYFDSLIRVLPRLKTYWLFFSGGEILHQDDAKDFIKDYRMIDSDTWFHLKTNGNADGEAIGFIRDCFDSIMVSFNGFSEQSYMGIMGVDINKTFSFCDNVKKYTNLCVKFLASPVCIFEIASFMEWAIDINAKCIAFQTVYDYSFGSDGKCSRNQSMFSGLDNAYWKEIFNRAGNKLNNVLLNNIKIINNDTRNLSSDKVILDVLELPEETKHLFRTDGVYEIE